MVGMADTVQIEDIITQRAVGDVQISPDGRQVVFSQGWASNTGTYPDADLWLAESDGSALRRLTPGESHAVQPRWSPDGSLIACLSDRHARGSAFDPERGPSGAVYLISPAGGEAVRLSDTEMRLRDPQWSPDGR